MPVSEPIDTFPSPDCWFGIGIKAVNEHYNHCGVIYFDTATCKKKILHLGWHNDLRHHELTTSCNYRWVRLTDLFDEDNARDFAYLCKWIFDANRDNVPYGVNSDGALIDEVTNVIDFTRGQSVGLTCATFSMLVFKRFGINLIDVNTWEHRESDEEWHRFVVEQLRQTDNVPEGHINIVEMESPCARIRPEEISASCSILNKPVDFTTVSEPSSRLHLEIR